MKILHIGLPRSSSTTLQEEIFPIIAKYKKTKLLNIIDYLDDKELSNHIKKNNIDFHFLKNQTNLNKNLPNSFIISNESLFSNSWEFIDIDNSFKYIKKNFSSDTKILIVLRNPFDYLNSIFNNYVVNLEKVKEDKFFYLQNYKKKINNLKKYNLFNFNYNNLINIYRTYFDEVIIVKHEKLKNLNILNEIFDLDKDVKIKLNKVYKNKIRNQSISYYGLRFLLFLNNIFDLKIYENFLRKLIRAETGIIQNKKLARVIKIFLPKTLFGIFFNKFFPYKKYYINKKNIPIDIEDLIENYEKMDDIKFFEKITESFNN